MQNFIIFAKVSPTQIRSALGGAVHLANFHTESVNEFLPNLGTEPVAVQQPYSVLPLLSNGRLH